MEEINTGEALREICRNLTAELEGLTQLEQTIKAKKKSIKERIEANLVIQSVDWPRDKKPDFDINEAGPYSSLLADFYENPNQTQGYLAKKYNLTNAAVSNILSKAFKYKEHE